MSVSGHRLCLVVAVQGSEASVSCGVRVPWSLRPLYLSCGGTLWWCPGPLEPEASISILWRYPADIRCILAALHRADFPALTLITRAAFQARAYAHGFVTRTRIRYRRLDPLQASGSVRGCVTGIRGYLGSLVLLPGYRYWVPAAWSRVWSRSVMC